jgi:tetratricopeptide (TPR) repeat protein
MRGFLFKILTTQRQWLYLSIVVLTFLVYSPSLFHVARSEQNLFLYETADITNIKDLVIDTYSYARTRMFAAGDKILFRPLLYLCFSFQKWIFGYHFFFWQLTAILLHLGIVWQLTRILNNFKPSALAFLFGLNFSLLHISQEMVIWHHMAPILLQLNLILAALFEFMRYIGSKQAEFFRMKRIAIYLTLAILIHEYALICCLIFIFILIFDQFKRRLPIKILAISTLLLPIFIFAILSLTDYWLRFGFPAVSAGNSFNFVQVLKYCGGMFSLAIVLPFFPSYLDIGLKSWSQSRLATDLSALGQMKIFGSFLADINFLLIMLLFFLAVGSAWTNFKNKASSEGDYLRKTISLTAFLLSLGYVLMIVGSRLAGRGFFYLNVNLFYFYPVILFSQIFIYQFFNADGHRKYIATGLIVALSLSIFLNGYKNYELNGTLKKHSEELVKERAMDVNQYYLFQKYAARGFIYLEQNKNDLALEDFNRALNIHLGSADVFNGRGVIYFRKGEGQKALEDYNRALMLNPQLAEAHSNRGIIYNQQGQYALAIKDFTGSLNINPKQPEIYNDRGNAYSRLEEFSLAIADYNEAIKQNSNLAYVYYDRGYVYNQIKQYPLAVEDFNQALTIDANYVQAYFQRAEAYVSLGKINEALKDYDELAKRMPHEELVSHKREQLLKRRSR